MREYEVVYIFRPEIDPDGVDERLDSYHEHLDGDATAVEHWGQRELAYEIEGERRGYYAVVQYRAEPESLSEFEQALKHDEDLIRHLLVLSEGELPTPPSERRADDEEDRGGGDGEDGDEEDEDEEDDSGDDDEGEDDEDDEGEGDEDEADDDADEGGDADDDDEEK